MKKKTAEDEFIKDLNNIIEAMDNIPKSYGTTVDLVNAYILFLTKWAPKESE